MNRSAAYWIALGVCVFGLGAYWVSPALRSYISHEARPAPDKLSLAVLANVSAPPQAPMPQNASTGNIATGNIAVNSIPESIVLPPQRQASAAPAMAPAQVIPLPTVTPTPQAAPPVEQNALVAQVASAAPNLEQGQVAAPTPVVEQSVVAPPSALVAQGNALPVAPANTLPADCWVETPPASLALDPFYAKYCAAAGVPIVASIAVPDAALQRAWEIVTTMLDGMPQGEAIRASIMSRSTRIGIIGANQVTTDLPEHRALYTLFPGVDWNTRARGVGATQEIPLLSVAEENLLCYAGDLWVGQNVLVHEFAHTIKNLGLDFVNSNFHVELQRIYQQARDAGLWANTYVISDVEEYWAEGVRIYFQVDAGGAPGGQSYPADSRAELQSYDPELYRIVESIFGPRGGIVLCPTR